MSNVDLDKLFEKLPYERLYTFLPWQRLLGLCSISLLFVGAAYFLFITDQHEQINTLELSLAQKQKEVRDNAILFKRKAEFEKRIAALNIELERAKGQLPSGKQIPALLEQISNIGTQAGLEFIEFRPQKEMIKEFYAEVPVVIKVTGSFHKIMKFFDDIGHMERIVTINKIKLQKRKSRRKTSKLTLSCTAVTYRYIDSEERKKLDKKKKKRKRR